MCFGPFVRKEVDLCIVNLVRAFARVLINHFNSHSGLLQKGIRIGQDQSFVGYFYFVLSPFKGFCLDYSMLQN